MPEFNVGLSKPPEEQQENRNPGVAQIKIDGGVQAPPSQTFDVGIERPLAQLPNPNYVAPVEAYNPYQSEVPQSVTEAHQQFDTINIATQDYADQMQARIIEDRNKYLADDNYQGMLNRQYTLQTYDYLRRKNNNADDPNSWSRPNPEDDLYSKWLPDWTAEQELRRQIAEKQDEPLSTEQQMVQSVYQNANATQQEIMDASQMEHGNWNLMGWWDRAKYLLTPGSSPYTVDDTPEWAKWIQSVPPALMAAGAGAQVGKMVGGGWGALIGAVAVGGMSYLQGVTGIEIPYFNDIMEWLDKPAAWVEQGQGMLGAAGKKAWSDLYGTSSIGEVLQSGQLDVIDLAKTMGEVLQDPQNKYLWEVGKYSYETSADLGFDDIVNTIRNGAAKFSDTYLGTDFGQRGINEVSRANLLRGGLEEVAEGTQGYGALIENYLPVFNGLVEEAMKNGYTEKQAVEFAHREFEGYMMYMGTTGYGRDFLAQSIADPMNLAPFVEGKIAEGVGKITKDTSLQTAGRVAQGNVLIDVLPPGVQQLAELALSPLDGRKVGNHALNFHSSQGLDTIHQTWIQGLRNTTDASTLNGIQRHFAGINPEGKLSYLDPNTRTGNAFTDWARNLFKQTDDSKMFDVSQTTADFVGSAIFNGDIPTYMIPDLIDQMIGKQPIPDDSPIARFRNSAMLNTLQDSFAGLDDRTINKIHNDVSQFRAFAEHRAVIDYVAEQLGMSPNDIFNAMDNTGINPNDPKYQLMSRREKQRALNAERNNLFDRIRNADLTFTTQDGKVLDASAIIKDISVFQKADGKNHVGRLQYSDTALRASIMDTVTRAADEYNLQRYGISPDSWGVRTANLMKSVQSIALLNFSTSYQVNNFLNNILTRSVAGVGGTDTKFVMDINRQRGLSFSRDSQIYKNTSDAIRNAKKGNDALQKVTDMYNKVTDCKLLNGVQNLDIEGMETKAAFDIGANRYWDATWGNMIPEMPKEWKALGITSEMNDQIFRLALDSPNLETFKQRMMGDVIIPGAKSTLISMLDNTYDANSSRILKDYFATKPWVEQYVDSFMQTGDPRLIQRGFEDLMNRLTNDVDLQNVSQMVSSFEDLRNRYANEGMGAVATSFEALNDLYTQMWINQTKENGTLFLDRVVRDIAPEKFDEMYRARMDIQINDYNIARGYTLMNMAALIDGLGLNSETGLALMNNAMQFYDLGEGYIREEHRLYQKYAKSNSGDYDFNKYRTEKMRLLEQTLNTQLEASQGLHKTMVDYLRNNLDESWTGHIDNFEKALNAVYDLKTADVQAELQDLQRRINKSGRTGREKESLSQERPRRARKQQIHDGYQSAANYLHEMETAIQGIQPPSTNMNLAETLRLELLYDESQRMADHAGQFLTRHKDGKGASKVFEPANFENRNVKTSFAEYGMKKIVDEAAKAGIDPMTEVRRAQAQFAIGDAVSLGTTDATIQLPFLDLEARTRVERPVLDHFQLLKPDVDPKVTGSKFSMARSEPYLYNGQMVNAGVFYKGEIIAYITQGMEQSVTVDGKTYPVIGISPKDPNTVVLYVGDKVREVTPGRPKNVEYTIYAEQNFHPGAPETTPAIEPMGQAALESSAGIRQALQRWQNQALDDLSKAQQNGSVFGNMSDAQRAAVLQYVEGDLRQAYNAQRFQTQRYGETMVDAALLNYNSRYGFDNMLNILCPYQFWMTRSIANWGGRMISKPQWFSTYSRLQNLIERNKKDFLPTRLEGMVGIPMANMDQGQGSAWYFDILGTLFPHDQFLNFDKYFVKNINTIHQNTLTRIDEMYEDNELFNGQPITPEMYEEAMHAKGDLYWQIYNDEKEHDESDVTSAGLLGTFLSPPVLIDALRKHAMGKDKSISYSPMFRMGNLIKATGDDTFMESFTDLIGNGLQLPENLMRKVMGIDSNPDGNYAQYGVITNIAWMAIDGEISQDDARNAIAEGAGNQIYDEALHRYRQANAYKMQGGALLTDVGQSVGGNKTTSVGQLAGDVVASIFKGNVLPDAERRHRERQAVLTDIRMTGDKDLKSDFYDEFPDYGIRNYAYEDDPEKLFHNILVDNLSNAYWSLPQEQRDIVYRQLGGRFQQLFADKETRATNALEDSEIIAWTRAMHGNVPELTEDQINGPMQDAVNLMWYTDSALGKREKYNREKERKFPGIDVVQEGYYNTAPEMRDQYLIQNPMLQDYWDWDRSVRAANPDLAVLMNNKSASGQVHYGTYPDITSAIYGRINSWTRSQLDDYLDFGAAMKPDAQRNLRTAYGSLMTNVPFDEWLKTLRK